MHENIRRFTMEGEVHYNRLVKTREHLEQALEGKMRDEGYVPVLDIVPHFTTNMLDSGKFHFALSAYGTYMGEDNWHIAGIMGGKTIMKHTPKNKLKAS